MSVSILPVLSDRSPPMAPRTSAASAATLEQRTQGPLQLVDVGEHRSRCRAIVAGRYGRRPGNS